MSHAVFLFCFVSSHQACVKEGYLMKQTSSFQVCHSSSCHLPPLLLVILSVESQKGSITIQHCSFEKTEGCYCCTKSIAILPYSDKRKQVTNLPNLRKWSMFRIGLSTFYSSLEQKHSSCSEIFKLRHHDIALMSMYITDTFLFIYEKCHF